MKRQRKIDRKNENLDYLLAKVTMIIMITITLLYQKISEMRVVKV